MPGPERWSTGLGLLALLASGCASVEARRTPDERQSSGSSIVRTGWPSEAKVRALQNEVARLDAFGQLLVSAGIEDRKHWPSPGQPLDRDGAMRLLDFAKVRKFVERYVRGVEGKDWDEVASKLARLGHWEFEDYRE